MEDTDKIGGKLKLVFRIFAWISAGFGVVFFFIILIGGGTPEAPRLTSLLALALGLFYFVFFYFIAEILRLLTNIDLNTRKKGLGSMPD
ncbi:MAG: hypothetical protein A2902_03170 [Elusimicrobia bacterium RIFCSPLOWO2_01_FULL_64_13]|nr:MAG: hypothetical protein A2636_04505 [Elusimicrobia bacterium RIFCSPHIGHO2_01_FULL_64_10]OGR96224.1 MAG: hypothetical protein A2902_03170 [Elusimicrobia bacterium RIFCSPLOWO2_01_FULL_64_13]